MVVLVGYASKHGSTQEIAERIAAKIREADMQVDLRSMDLIEDAAAYDAVILGSAIHDGDWLPEAVAFVRRSLEPLANRPLWLFNVSTVGETSSAFPGPVARWFRKMRRKPKTLSALLPALHVRDHHDFAGVIKRGDWPLAGDLFLKLLGGHYGDLRDWQEVDAWAGAIALHLGGSTASQATMRK